MCRAQREQHCGTLYITVKRAEYLYINESVATVFQTTIRPIRTKCLSMRPAFWKHCKSNTKGRQHTSVGCGVWTPEHCIFTSREMAIYSPTIGSSDSSAFLVYCILFSVLIVHIWRKWKAVKQYTHRTHRPEYRIDTQNGLTRLAAFRKMGGNEKL